jgi:hypothetical protein
MPSLKILAAFTSQKHCVYHIGFVADNNMVQHFPIFLNLRSTWAFLFFFLSFNPKLESPGLDSRWGHWIFNLSNPSSRTMALGSTQPLTERSIRNLWGGKWRPERKPDNLTAICELIVEKMWVPRRLTTLWTSTACYRNIFTFYLI